MNTGREKSPTSGASKPRLLSAWLFLLCLQSPASCAVGLEWVPDANAQVAFEGKARSVRATFRNPGPADLEINLRTRLWQTTSATAAPFGDVQKQRSFRVPAGATVLEAVVVDFPSVTAKTSFLLEWGDEQNKIIAKTSVLVFPLQLLGELKNLAGEPELGILDPANRFKPWLKKSGVNFIDLESMELEQFTGRLVIFALGRAEAEGTYSRLLSKALQKTAVLWFRPPRPNELEPSSFIKTTSGAALVVANARIFADFENDPVAHLNLVRLARWAVLADRMDLTLNEPR